MLGDLTTLANLKAYLGNAAFASDTSQDAMLGRMITAASRFVTNFCQRTRFAVSSFDETYDGYGNNFMVLRQWPIVSITAINFSGLSLTAQASGNPPSGGYRVLPPGDLGQQRVQLYGYCFPRGRGAIEVQYVAGFQSSEAAVVPSASPYTYATALVFLGDRGVVYTSSGAALTAVASSPAAGQYAVDNLGNYTFAAADAGQAVTITYSNTPADVEQATIEIIAERFRYKDRVGMVSKTISGGITETTAFSQKDITDFARTLLSDYVAVAPL